MNQNEDAMEDQPQNARRVSDRTPATEDAQMPLWPAADGEGSIEVSSSAPEATPDLTPPEPTEIGPDVSSSITLTDQPWKFSDLGLFVVFAAISFFFANAVALGFFVLVHGGEGVRPRLDDMATATPYIVLMQVLWESLWLVFIYFLITQKYRQPFWQAIRWKSVAPGPKTYLFGGIVLAIVTQLIFSFFPTEDNLPIERLFSSPTSGYMLAVFGICVAPFMEELVFRGFFYPVFERVWGLAAAVISTGLLFALIHGPQLNGGATEMAAIFCVGLTLSYARGRSGSLMVSYLMHLGYNATLFFSLYVGTDQFRNL